MRCGASSGNSDHTQRRRTPLPQMLATGWQRQGARECGVQGSCSGRFASHLRPDPSYKGPDRGAGVASFPIKFMATRAKTRHTHILSLVSHNAHNIHVHVHAAYVQVHVASSYDTVHSVPCAGPRRRAEALPMPGARGRRRRADALGVTHASTARTHPAHRAVPAPCPPRLAHHLSGDSLPSVQG